MSGNVFTDGLEQEATLDMVAGTVSGQAVEALLQ
jgi:hypothetical protein